MLGVTQTRRVFGDLTNTASRDSLKHRACGGNEPTQTSDCPVYASKFCILEDASYQETQGVDCDDYKDSTDLILPQATTSSRGSSADIECGCSDALDICGRDQGIAELVALCAADLCDLWMHSARSGGRRIPCLWQRFSAVGPPQLAAVFFSPPSSTPPLPSQVGKGRNVKRRGVKSNHIRGPCDTCHVHSGSCDDLPTVKKTLMDLACHDNAEQKADSCLQDLCHSMLRSSQEESKRSTPSASSILRNLRAEDRETTLLWLFQVCATVNIQDSVLYLSVLLLDRFCASLVVPIPLERLQLVTVAIISISLKVNGAVDESAKSPKMQNLLLHLGQHQFTMPQINSAEHEVLRRLDFSVTMPSAVDFLDTFLLPHCSLEGMRVSPVLCLAKFCLQLSLLDAPLHYRYPHSVLAAGAMHVALWCTQTDPEHTSALLEDAATCCSKEEIY